MNVFRLTSICKRFGGRTALHNINLSINSGERLAIVGPSGSGKSTLLRIIAGFEQPDTGGVEIDGQILVSDDIDVAPHKRMIGYVPQDGALFPHLRVGDNIGFGLRDRREDKQARIRELLDQVQLGPELANRWPHELSGGQQQRVSLARALAQRPRLMLLDEPFSALDTGLRSTMRKMVSQVLEAAGITTILVTHDQAEALSFAHTLAVMRQGRIVQSGPPRDLYLKPADEETALFLGDAVILPATIEGWVAHCALGELPTHTYGHARRARILLRPEQLVLGNLPGDKGAWGQVVEHDFCGERSTSAVRLETAGHPTVAVRSAEMTAPVAGSRVRVQVNGNACILPAGEPDETR